MYFTGKKLPHYSMDKMNAKRNSQLDHFHNSKKAIRRKKSYFWNTKTTCETIDNKDLTEIGTHKQTVNINGESAPSGPIKKNIFSKFLKKANELFVKLPNVSQRGDSKGNKETTIKHSQSMMNLKQNYDKRPVSEDLINKRRSMFIPSNDKSTAVLSPLLLQPLTTSRSKSDKNELNEWKNTLLNELDATQYGTKNDKFTLFDLRINDNTDCNELAANTLQPSGMENNKSANQRFATMLDAKLGIIPRKTIINDWLDYNNCIPESATSEMPVSSYLQHYHNTENNNVVENIHADKTSSSSFTTAPERKVLQEGSSILSAQIKSEKYDHVKEKLEIAAARRNAIKTNRLKEQMDTALFETIHMLREYNDINNQQTIMQQQHVEEWLYGIDKKLGDRKTYLSSASEATVSTSLSNDCHFSYRSHTQQPVLETSW